MNVIEAITTRRSTRAFLPTPIEKEKLDAVLAAATRTPSWANSQPWDILVVTGGTLKRIKNIYQQQYKNKTPTVPEIPRPAQWPDAAEQRIRQLHPDMVRTCGNAAISDFAALNQEMFLAPAIVCLCMDKRFSEWSLYDLGAYSQSFMLAALEQGLSTMPTVLFTLYPEVLRRELQVPIHLKIVIGIAVGYADPEHGINKFVSSRRPLSEVVRFFK